MSCKPQRRPVKRSNRCSSVRQSTRLGFDQLEARNLLATLVVNSASDGPVDLTDNVVTLRDAIEAANNDTLVAPGGETGSGADTITFDASVFTGGESSLIRLTAGELEITDTLTIDGSIATGVTITGDAADDDVTDAANITDVAASGVAGLNDNSRVLNFSSATGDLSLESLTLTGGRTTGDSQRGGAILFSSSDTLTVTSSTVSGNSTSGYLSDGGGIGTNSGSVILTSSTLSDNSTSGSGAEGGGIFAFSGSVSLASSTLSDNSTVGLRVEGGGIFTNSGDVTLASSTLSGNSTSGNFAFGGGIFTNSGDVSLTSSTLSGNSTSGYLADGGGIRTSSGAVSLTSSTLSGNSTSGMFADGAGIHTLSGAVSLISSTLSENETALGIGGGVFVFDASVNPSFTIENSIVAGNTGNGTAPDLRPDPDSTLTINNSLIGSTDLSIVGAGNQIGTLADPVAPLLGPLTDNGGPTLTHALLLGSPAIDAGGDGVAQTEDQRGLARNVNGVDIGAFELQPAAPPTVRSFTRDEGGALDTLARPDLLSTVSVSFDVDVSVSVDDLEIRNDTLGGSLVDTSDLVFSYDASTQTATWGFGSLTLDAGFYSFELSSDIVSVDDNLSLDGDADGIAGGALIEPIYVALPGDANLDGQVDVLNDAFLLVGNLGTTGGATWAQGDFNGDGNVDVLNDAFILVGRLGQSVVAPALAQLNSSLAVTLAPDTLTPSTAVIVEQAVAEAGDKDELVASVPRSAVAKATSLELSGDQVRDDAFASEFGSLDSFWV